MDGYIGEIRAFGRSVAPENWHNCDGATLQISTYEALYSLIGTTYGGDGKNTFALPDLRGRAPIGVGNGTGLTPRLLGAKGGTEFVALITNQEPIHNHLTKVSTAGTPVTIPVNNTSYLSSVNTPDSGATVYGYLPGGTSGTTPTSMDTNTLLPSGVGQAHNNMMPSLPVNYIICLIGLFPTQS